MPAPSTPTSFAVDSTARPWTASLSGGQANYTAVKLTWAHAGAWIRLQILTGGVWLELAQGALANGYHCRSLTSTSAEIFAIGSGGVSFRVAAGNSSGQSAWSSTLVVAGAGAAVVLADLTAPTATLTTNSTSLLKVDWTDVQGAESFFELELINPTAGTSRIYGLGTFVREFSRAIGVDGVLASTSFVARVRAVSTALSTRLEGPWSNELVFTTLAPVIVLTRLPETVDFWRTVALPGSYTIVTNTPPTSTSTGTLPTGLTHTSGVISGIPTAAVGSYAVNITATNAGGSDVKVLTFNIREPSIELRFARTGGVPVDATAANLAGVGKGALGIELEVLVRAAATGPVSTTFSALTISGAPAWLTVNALVSLKGTPDVPGEWDVSVTGANATGQTASAVIRIIVAAVAFTSPDTLTVYEQQPIAFTLDTAPDADAFSATGLPAWLSLTGGSLTGLAPSAGNTFFSFTARLGVSTASQEFALHVLPVLSGPALAADGVAEITGWVGDPLIEAVYYFADCSIEHWYLSNQPPGVDVGELTCPGPYATGNAVAIVGAPATYGIFEAVVTAQCCCDGAPKLYRLPVRFNISGGLFLHWFHGDVFRRELQVLMRTGEVRSLYETSDATLALKRGDVSRLHVLFRDGPFADSRLGREILSEGFDELRLVIRPQGDFDGEPYLEAGGAITSETIAGETVFYFDLTVKSPAIEAAFDSLNTAPGANTAAVALAATGELTWKRGASDRSSLSFAVQILQDVDR